MTKLLKQTLIEYKFSSRLLKSKREHLTVAAPNPPWTLQVKRGERLLTLKGHHYTSEAPYSSREENEYRHKKGIIYTPQAHYSSREEKLLTQLGHHLHT